MISKITETVEIKREPITTYKDVVVKDANTIEEREKYIIGFADRKVLTNAFSFHYVAKTNTIIVKSFDGKFDKNIKEYGSDFVVAAYRVVSFDEDSGNIIIEEL